MENELILVVDDEPKNIRYLGNILRERGYKVSFASNGVKALLLLENTKPDLILLDINMPVMDGFSVCEKIKQNPEQKDIPIIFLTSQTQTEYIVKGFELGSVDYVIKPFNQAELLARVKTQLEIKRAQNEIINYNRQLKDINAKLNEELLRASEYVVSLLPKNINSENIKTDWRYIPSSFLGGDSFGFRWLDEENLAVYLVDVSGHGVNSALLSVSILNILNTNSLAEVDFNDPASVLSALNNKFRLEDSELNFFTVWYGVINKSTKEIIYSSAGHPPAVLLTDNSAEPILLKEDGLWLGAFRDSQFHNSFCKMDGRCKLFVFSDGLFEIQSDTENIFTFNDLVQVIKSSGDKTSNSLDNITAKLNSINKEARFEDDLAIVKIDFR